MTTITARVVEDSTVEGHRFTTMVLRYPRFVHEELLMYGTFARSCASSRAKPTARWLNEVKNDPAMPVFWTKNRSGMQGERIESEEATLLWRSARRDAVYYSERLALDGVHKQDANRLLHPFQHIDVVLSGVRRSFENLFHQRLHGDAMPTFRVLAYRMAEAYFGSEPVRRLAEDSPYRWHLPFVTAQERGLYQLDALRRISAARCARTSYSNHDGTDPDPFKDLELFEKLAVRKEGEWNPIHGNPLEHQAEYIYDWTDGRFPCWRSYRDCTTGASFGQFDELNWRERRATIAQELGIKEEKR